MGKILKTTVLIVLVLFVTAFTVNAYNNSPNVILNRVFKGKVINPRVLIYRIYALGILPIGKAVFYNAEPDKLNGQDIYHVRAQANTSGLAAVFFKAQANLDSYISSDDNNPVLFKQKITISGKPSQDKEVSYDQKQRLMTLANVKREIMPDTQDPLSLMYNLKKINFDKNKDIEIGINTNQKNYVLRGKIERKQISNIEYKVYYGKATIMRRDKNNPYHRSQITMILFKIENDNIPILIKVLASGFPITARLVEVE